jgi:hypothetical protein
VASRIEAFEPATGMMRVSLVRQDGQRDVVRAELKSERDGKRLASSAGVWPFEMSPLETNAG